MWKHTLSVSVLLCVSYGIIFICGILGNGFIIACLIRNKSFRSTTNIFIGNLAVADILTTIFCVPFTLASNLMTEWPFGGVLCKLVAYIQAVAVNASINNLVTISIDRCMSINRPFSFIKRKRKLIIALIAIWVLPIIYMAPWLFVFSSRTVGEKKKYKICADFWASKKASDAYFIIVNLILSYIFPLLIISICYLIMYKKISTRTIPGEMITIQRKNNSKIRIIKMIFFVVIVLAISWLPLYLLFIAAKFLDYPDTREELNSFNYLFPIAQWLATTNVCINPIIYTIYSRKFRNEFRVLIENMNFIKKKDVMKASTNLSTVTQECILLSTDVI